MASASRARAELELGHFGELREWWVGRTASDGQLQMARLVALQRNEVSLRSEGAWTAGPSSLLEVLRLQRDEVRNCRVLRWLLDPITPHGLGAVVLERFLADLADAGAPLLDEPHLATVETEVTRADTRADIVVRHPRGTVVVEAKINAGEGDGQGAGLAAQWPGATLVFLTRSGAAMTSAGGSTWIRYRWRRILQHVDDALDQASAPANRQQAHARRAVADYLEGTRGL